MGTAKYSGNDRKMKELEKLKSKISSLQNQIEATTERITELPKGIDAKVFYDQLLKLQEHKVNFETQLQSLQAQAAYQDQPIDFEDFQKFTEGLKELSEKCTDPNQQAAIIRKIVARIEVTPISIVIHYNVGETHYKRELSDHSTFGAVPPGLALVAENTADKGASTNKKGLVNFARPFTKPLFKFSYDACSNTLKNGSERLSRIA